MNAKQSEHKQNQPYTHYNKIAENQDKEKILKAVWGKKKKQATFICAVLCTEQVLEKYLLNE